jgi:disulfide bond formation protein DsbB
MEIHGVFGKSPWISRILGGSLALYRPYIGLYKAMAMQQEPRTIGGTYHIFLAFESTK